MTDPYGQQPFGQQQPGGQQPFGQPGPTPYGGQPAPFGQPAPYGQGAPFGAPRNYATWGQRALGWLVDFGPIFVLYAIFGLLYAVIHNVGSLIIIVGVLAWLGWIAWTIYNRWIQQGNTGQSMGKRIAKIKLVREDNGQPVGAGMAFVRDLAHFVDNVICYVGWLWPLWDDKAQTLADKIVGTVVVQADDAAAPTQFGQPGAQQFAGGYPPPSGGFEQQAPGGFGQPQPGGVAQPPQAGGFPQSGGFDQPQSGGFPQQPQPGGLDQPQAGGFPQQPQPGGFDQPQPGGFPQQPPQSGG
ncbi:RDD family protein, partial [Amycolatopsis sp. SID8362]|uniref:RDD family protein n=1 Tax=Amycolatopsis sp. SID8362 TaxID=2690346 RepID=UPI00136BAD4E